ncbi:MAG: chemotaxis protein CheW [Thermodesulfobacteriota bacterium]
MVEEESKLIDEMDDDADDLYEREEEREETVQLVVFRLAREWYGVDIRKVKEIIKLNRVAHLPSSPQQIAGIVNLRGNILSVTDLKVLLNLSREQPGEKAKIIAVESGILETGLLADEVMGSVEVPVRMIGPVIPTIPAEGARYLEGQCKVAHKLIGVLSVEKVLEIHN